MYRVYLQSQRSKDRIRWVTTEEREKENVHVRRVRAEQHRLFISRQPTDSRVPLPFHTHTPHCREKKDSDHPVNALPWTQMLETVEKITHSLGITNGSRVMTFEVHCGGVVYCITSPIFANLILHVHAPRFVQKHNLSRFSFDVFVPGSNPFCLKVFHSSGLLPLTWDKIPSLLYSSETAKVKVSNPDQIS